MSDKPAVLFVRVHNAGRSLMAAAWLSHLAGDRIEVCSAASAPAGQVNLAAVEAMAEVGIDITAEQPKLLTVDALRASDVCITMGCGDAYPCPASSAADAQARARGRYKLAVEGRRTLPAADSLSACPTPAALRHGGTEPLDRGRTCGAWSHFAPYSPVGIRQVRTRYSATPSGAAKTRCGTASGRIDVAGEEPTLSTT